VRWELQQAARSVLARTLALIALIAVGSGIVAASEAPDRPVDPTTFVDHDAHPPIPEPAAHEATPYRYYNRY